MKWSTFSRLAKRFNYTKTLEGDRRNKILQSYKYDFEKKVVFLGCGSVAQCAIPMFMNHVSIDPRHVTVIDFDASKKSKIAEEIQKGVSFVNEPITRDNYAATLSKYASPGSLIIDLTWDVDTIAMLQYCYNNEISYINTAVEEWEWSVTDSHYSLTLNARQHEISKMVSQWNQKKNTMIIDHGANPGLVSHFLKYGLLDIAKAQIAQAQTPEQVRKAQELTLLVEGKQYSKLAQTLGLKVVHISERDSQITNKPRRFQEMVNTWSVYGFLEESFAPSEVGWGTHEKFIPEGSIIPAHNNYAIILPSRGLSTMARSWVPSGDIIGYIIRHGEALSISNSFTVKNDQNQVIYRPTVHYVYCPSDSAIASLHEYAMSDFQHHMEPRILTEEDILSGNDELGCLLLGDFGAWWVGSVLSIEESRRIMKRQNATSMQVAAGVVASALYAAKYPRLGFCTPDDLDHKFILDFAHPYLGQFVSQKVNWTPYGKPSMQFGKHKFVYPNHHQIDSKNVDFADENALQFRDFVVAPMFTYKH